MVWKPGSKSTCTIANQEHIPAASPSGGPYKRGGCPQPPTFVAAILDTSQAFRKMTPAARSARLPGPFPAPPLAACPGRLSGSRSQPRQDQRPCPRTAGLAVAPETEPRTPGRAGRVPWKVVRTSMPAAEFAYVLFPEFVAPNFGRASSRTSRHAGSILSRSSRKLSNRLQPGQPRDPGRVDREPGAHRHGRTAGG